MIVSRLSYIHLIEKLFNANLLSSSVSICIFNQEVILIHLLLWIKVAPYSFMTARTLMMRAVVICARSHKIVVFSPDFYDVSIAKKAKLTVHFLASPSANFFFNFAHLEILTLPFTNYFLEKFCQSNPV